jgi:hypothetical protein
MMTKSLGWVAKGFCILNLNKGSTHWESAS